MNRKELHQRLLLKRKTLRNTMIILLVLALPVFMIGWQRFIIADLFGGSAALGLIYIFALTFPLVPFFFIVGVILAFALGWIENNKIKKITYLVIGAFVSIPAYFTFIDFLG